MKIILLSFFRQKTNKGQCMAWHNGKFWPLYVPEWYHPKVSQYFFDPYSFCHILHGFIFYGLWGWWVPSTFGWGETQTWWWTWVCGAFLGLFMEFCHEMIENSEIGISRFRNTSGTSEFYKGDSLQNIIGDIISYVWMVLDCSSSPGWLSLACATLDCHLRAGLRPLHERLWCSHHHSTALQFRINQGLAN